MSALSYKAPSVLDDCLDREFTREEWLAWYEDEYAGYQVEREDQRVVDDAGELDERREAFAMGLTSEEVDYLFPAPAEVMAHVLLDDRATAHFLQRSGGNAKGWKLLSPSAQARLGRKWQEINRPGVRRNSEMLREGPDGSATVVGEHPFSTDEGAAEWLGRVRSELRVRYREAARANDRRGMSALVARDAALRARHNARLWARAFARYHRLGENETLKMLDAWQKANPIGWLGLEASMRKLFESCADHHLDAHLAWQKRFPFAGDQRLKDEWLAEEPVPPQNPEHLVTSAKAIRRYEPKRETTGSAPSDFQIASSKHRSKVQRDRDRRARVAAAVSGRTKVELPPKPSSEEVAAWVEFARSEAVYEKQTVPESYPLDWQHGQLCTGRCCSPR